MWMQYVTVKIVHKICTCNKKYNEWHCQIACRGWGDMKSLFFFSSKRWTRKEMATSWQWDSDSQRSQQKATSGLRQRSTKFNTAKRHKMKWRLHFGHTLEIWKMHEALGEEPPTSIPAASPKLWFPWKHFFFFYHYAFVFFFPTLLLFCV